MIKEALQVESVKKLSPLFILDDVQKFCEDGAVKPDAVDFLTWCQEMTNLSLMNFVMISSDRQAIEPLQKRAFFYSVIVVSLFLILLDSVGILCAFEGDGDALCRSQHSQIPASVNSYGSANIRPSTFGFARDLEPGGSEQRGRSSWWSYGRHC